MCLLAYNQPPKIATDDIPIFKYLFYNDTDNTWRTLYTLTEVPENGILIGEFTRKFDKQRYKNQITHQKRSHLQINSGFIHAFTTAFARNSIFPYYKQYNNKYTFLIRSYIPKGTQYHISIDGREICAKKIILTFD